MHATRERSSTSPQARRWRRLAGATAIALALWLPSQAARAQSVLSVPQCLAPSVSRLASLASARSGARVEARVLDDAALRSGMASGAVPLALWCRVPSRHERVAMQTHLIGYGGMAVIVNGRNPVIDLDRHQLAAIYAQRITSWHDAGGGTDKPIVRIVKAARSLPPGPVADLLAAPGVSAEGAQLVDADLPAILFVAVDPYAIGYVGIAAAAQLIAEGARVKTVAIGGRVPALEQVRSGAYPLAWPVYLVASRRLSQAQQRLQAFLAGPEGRRALAEAGLVPAQDGKP